jgi:small conductance mechanosensitive channel
MEYTKYFQTALDWFLNKGLIPLLVIVLALLVLRIARLLVNRLFDAFAGKQDLDSQVKQIATLKSVVRSAVTIVIVVVAAMTFLKEAGVDIGPILAAAGIVGLAVGFGAQELVKDVISGFFILMEGQIRVGDVVDLTGHSGKVERLTLRMTVLRDLSGNVHYVRNGTIDTVTNMTTEFSYYLFDIGVAYREDVDEVTGVIKEVDEELRSDSDFSGDILEPIDILGLDQFADSAVVIRARIKTRPIRQWRVGREFNARLKKAFDARDIEIPFPHITVYMGQDKQGQAPPVRVAQEAASNG